MIAWYSRARSSLSASIRSWMALLLDFAGFCAACRQSSFLGEIGNLTGRGWDAESASFVGSPGARCPSVSRRELPSSPSGAPSSDVVVFVAWVGKHDDPVRHNALCPIHFAQFCEMGGNHEPTKSNPPKRNNGLRSLLRPLPVICWDWTKAIATAIARGPAVEFRRDLLLGRGARCPRPQSPHVRYYCNNQS